jgi:hypothetical protein
MTTINIYEAKTQLSKLVEKAASGTDVIIARGGQTGRSPDTPAGTAAQNPLWPSEGQGESG